MRLRVVLLCVILEMPIPSCQKSERSPPKGQTAQQQQPTAQNSSTTPAAFSPATKRSPDKPASDGSSKSAPDWWMIGLTGGLLLVAIFQVRLFWRQLEIMNGSLADTKMAADAALIGANAARASVDAAMGSERAYLFFDAVASHELTKGQPSVAPDLARQIVFTNYGKTPAIFQALSAAFGYAPRPPHRAKGEAPDLRGKGGMAISSGGSTGPHTLKLNATADQIKAASRGSGGIYLAGQLDYDDVFGKHHTTVFCWHYTGSGFKLVDDRNLNYHT
jgi:hypothetical protein